MKKRTRTLGAIAAIVLLISVSTIVYNGEPQQVIHEPTEFGSDEDGEDHEGREAYLKFRFGGTEEYDWEEEYGNVRRNAAEERNRSRRSLSRSGALPTEEVLANGSVTGQWIERGAKNQAGRVVVTDILESKDLVVLGTEGGSVMTGPISGNEYEILNDHMRFNLKSVHSFELNNGSVRIVAVDANSIYYTDNKGVAWEKSYDGRVHTSTISREDNIIYAVTTGGSVISSTDMGMSFSTIGSVPRNFRGCEIWTPRYASGEVYVLTDQELYKKSGNDFVYVSTLSQGSSTSKLAISGDNSKANSKLFAAFHGSSTTVLKSSDDGVTWSRAGSPSTGMFSANSFYSSTEEVLYAGEMECYRSKNGGTSWTKINTWTQYYETYGGDPEIYLHADIPEIRSYRDNSGKDFTLISTDGGTYITYNHSDYRNITMTGMRNNQYYGSASRWDNPDIILAGAQDQGAQISQPGNDGPIMDFYQYASGDQGSYTSSDSGKSCWFTYIYGSLYYHPNTNNSVAHGAGAPSSSDNFLWISPTVADPDNPKVVYTGGSSVYKSEYFSSTNIRHSKLSGSLGATITALSISPVDNNHWYAATKNKEFYHSSDRGINWTKMSSSIPANNWLVGQGIAPDPLVLGRVYLSGNGNGNPAVLISDDHGRTFAAAGTEVPTTSVLDLEFNDNGNLLFAAAYDAAYVFVVSESKWYNLTGINGPDTPYFTVEYIPTIQTARFATHGRGIWDFKIGEVVEPDPYITVESPNGGELYNVGDTVNISWKSNVEGEISVNLHRNGVFDETLTTLDVSINKHQWIIAEEFNTEGTFAIEITSATNSLADTSDAVFTLSNLKKIPQTSISIESFSSEYSADYSAALAIDGDNTTFWHNITDGTDDLPSELVFKLDNHYRLTAFSYLPRQDGSLDSRAKEYEFFVSTDNVSWTKINNGIWEDIDSERTEIFAEETDAVQYVKFVSLSSTNASIKASVAEFNLFYSRTDQVGTSTMTKVISSMNINSYNAGKLSISIPTPGNYNVVIHSLNGRVIFERQHDFSAGLQEINLNSLGLARQIGIVSITGEGQELVQKLTIQ